MNARWIVSIKTDLIPNDSIYMFGDPKFIGKSYELEPTSMYVKRDPPWMIEWFAFESIGG